MALSIAILGLPVLLVVCGDEGTGPEGEPTPGANYALRFYGWNSNNEGRAAIVPGDTPLNVGAGDFTIEFWVNGLLTNNTQPAIAFCNDGFEQWINGSIIIDRDRNGQARDWGISFGAGVPSFGVGDDGGSYYTVCATTNVLDGQWRHLAFTRTRSSGELAIYVDGVREVSRQGPTGDISYPVGAGGSPRDPEIVLGAEKHDAVNRPFDGEMDELRFSEVVRYTGASVAVPTGRFGLDGNTVGLYHFDEGSGRTIRDGSGATGGGVDGVLRIGGFPPGPVWVLSGAPTGRE